MRKDFGVKTYVFPQPVLVLATYDADGNANAMTAAWGGIADDNEIMVCLANHKTTDNLQLHRACTISMGDVKNVVACDYVGMASGNDVENKVAKAGWSVTKSAHVDAPLINELPVAVECTLIKVVDDCKYFFRIENVSIDESVLTDGALDMTKFRPITYDTSHHNYYELGAKVGKAFFDGLSIK